MAYKDSERARAAKKRWTEEHPDYWREWYHRNGEQQREYNREKQQRIWAADPVKAREKALANYYKHRESIAAAVKQRSQESRAYMEQLRVERGPCQHCGEARPEKLVFHHTDRAAKDFTIGKAHRWAKARILAEVEKCIVLCRSCHIKHHHALGHIPPRGAAAH